MNRNGASVEKVVLFGREKECQFITGLMNVGKNIIIYGEEGTGKSAIIHEIVNRREEVENVLYSRSSKTLKESLINPILFHDKGNKNSTNMNISMLRKVFFRMLNREKPAYIIFDHVELVTPRLYSFFLYVMDKKIPLIMISRGIRKKDIDHLRMILFDFIKVEIKNLEKSATDKLVDYFVKEFNIKVNHTDDFRKDIYKFSGGSPKIVKELCFMAKDAKYHSCGNCNVRLIDLDHRIGKATGGST